MLLQGDDRSIRCITYMLSCDATFGRSTSCPHSVVGQLPHYANLGVDKDCTDNKRGKVVR